MLYYIHISHVFTSFINHHMLGYPISLTPDAIAVVNFNYLSSRGAFMFESVQLIVHVQYSFKPQTTLLQ